VQFEPFQQEPIITFFMDSEGRAMFRQENDIRPIHEIPLDKTDLMVNYLRVAKVWNADFSEVHFALYLECLERKRLCKCSLLCLDDRF
jgi:hypothetical protein